ncbi:MAG: hypothetical protein WB498_00305 [Candidatus Binatus sp.]
MPLFAPPLAFDLAAVHEGYTGPTVGLKLTFLTVVEQPVAVQRVVLNARAGEEGCDFVRETMREDILRACLESAQANYGPEAVAAARASDERAHREADEECARNSATCAHAAWRDYRGKAFIDFERTAPSQLQEAKADCIKGDPDKPWPRTLKTGDSMTIDAVSCGDRIVDVRVITDRGEATYQLR